MSDRFVKLAEHAIDNPREYVLEHQNSLMLKEAGKLSLLFNGIKAVGNKVLKPGVVRRFAGHHAINSGIYAMMGDNPDNKGILSRFGSAVVNPWVLASSAGTTYLHPRVSRFLGNRGKNMFLRNADKTGLFAKAKQVAGRHMMLTSPETASLHRFAVQKAGGNANYLRELTGMTGASNTSIAKNLKGIDKIYNKSNLLGAKKNLIKSLEKQVKGLGAESKEAVSLNSQIKSLKSMSNAQHDLASNKGVMTRLFEDKGLMKGMDPSAIKTRGFMSEVLSPISPNSMLPLVGLSPMAAIAGIPLIGPAANSYSQLWEPGALEENMEEIGETLGTKRFDYSKLGPEAGSFGGRLGGGTYRG